jgi:gluconate kinase
LPRNNNCGARPTFQFRGALQHIQRHGVILHRHGTLRVRFERFHARLDIRLPASFVHLQIQRIRGDDAEEQVLVVQTAAPEHRP